MSRLGTYAAVAAGGALGSLARYGVAFALWDPRFPWATLAVNVAGSFLITLFATLNEAGGRLDASPGTRQFVMAGFCGGFTTFSVFSLETVRMAQGGAPGLAAAYAALSALFWLGGAWAGQGAAARLNRRG